MDVTNATNGELLEEIKDTHSAKWQQCVDELDARMTAANVKGKKGFDTPPPPPIP